MRAIETIRRDVLEQRKIAAHESEKLERLEVEFRTVLARMNEL